MPAKLTFAEVKKTFSDAGCVLLAKSYQNARIKLPYICECGTRHSILLHNFTKGKRCPTCKSRKCGEARRFTLDEAREMFRAGGCVLLATESTDSHTYMP